MDISKPKVKAVEELKALAPSDGRWIECLLPDQRMDMEEIRRAFRDGKLKHLSVNAIANWCIKKFSLTVSTSTVSKWICDP